MAHFLDECRDSRGILDALHRPCRRRHAPRRRSTRRPPTAARGGSPRRHCRRRARRRARAVAAARRARGTSRNVVRCRPAGRLPAGRRTGGRRHRRRSPRILANRPRSVDGDRLEVGTSERPAQLGRLGAVELQHVERDRRQRARARPPARGRRTVRRSSRTAASRRRSPRAFAVSTTRGVPDQNTKPIASAPARAAARPSSTRVMPQILTRVRTGFVMPRSSRRGGSAAARTARRSRRRRSRARRPRTSAPRACGRGASSSSPIQPELASPGADVDQRADDVADHVVEERIGARSRSGSASPSRRTCARASVFTGDFAWHSAARKAREVVRADEPVRAPRCMAADVERPMVPADAPGEQRRPFGAVLQQVGVVARGRGEARVERAVHRRRPEYRGRGWQGRVDAAHPRRVGAHGVRVEVDDLRNGVYARIGAPSRGNAGPARPRSLQAHARARPARRNPRAATGSRRTRGRRIRERGRCAWRKTQRAAGRPPVARDANRAVSRAWRAAPAPRLFCWSSPSCSTSCRISRAPSTSPIS